MSSIGRPGTTTSGGPDRISSSYLDLCEGTSRQSDSILSGAYQHVLPATRAPSSTSSLRLPISTTQTTDDFVWKTQTLPASSPISVLSQTSSIRSFRSSSRSEEVLQGNIERLARHSIQKMSPTPAKVIGSRYPSSRSTSSADVLRLNKAVLAK